VLPDRELMPERGSVDPAFDGHLERGLLALTVTERLDWIWAAMEMLRVAEARRDASARASSRAYP
jgi:hypothetical protein